MMAGAERTIRAYRPSRFTPREDFDEVARLEREQNLVKYMTRARDGLPLFEGGTTSPASAAPSKRMAVVRSLTRQM